MVQVEVISRIDELPAAEWDALVDPDDPFVEHAFLSALERSESVSSEAGWTTCHLGVREAGALVAAMPLYLKMHSYGEYIFDWGWADAAIRAGLRYYPKLVSAVPFTPVTGRRLLLGGPARVGDPRIGALIGGMNEIASSAKASSWHVLFCTEDEQKALAAGGGLSRLTFQFHWENQGYESFDHWLSTFRSRERKKARRERQLPPGVEVVELSGSDIGDREIAAIYRFYQDTVDRKGGHDYLTEGFFHALRDPAMLQRVIIFAALQHDQIVSAALTFQKGAGLYGRYWGCRPGFHGLHFELCYHRPIERCIRLGLRRFEAGAQGTHKLKRGLMPSPTFSSHRLFHNGLHRAVADAVRQEARQTTLHMAALASHGPFRRDSGEEDEQPIPEGPAEVGG